MALGCPDAFALDYGRGRMEHLWLYCLNGARCIVHEWEVDLVLGVGATAMLIDARLAEITLEGLYIKGTKGRVEWLEEKRDLAAKARKSKAKRKVVTKPTITSGTSGRYQSTDTQEQEQEQEKEILSSLLPDSDARAPDMAAEVYALYPRKEGKTPGLKKLRPQLKTAADGEAAKIAVKNYAASVAHREIGHVKLFSSWVSEWQDWISPEPSHAAARASPSVGRFDSPPLDTSRMPDFSKLGAAQCP
jgi:hypothetical protein